MVRVVNFFGNSHSRIALEKGESETLVVSFRSAIELQLSFLDPSLDQLIEGSV